MGGSVSIDVNVASRRINALRVFQNSFCTYAKYPFSNRSKRRVIENDDILHAGAEPLRLIETYSLEVHMPNDENVIA
jgi:hypothetical protein